MKSKEIISILSHLDPDMPLDGLKITKKGISPFIHEKPIYTAVAAFWGAFLGIVAVAALAAFMQKL